MQRRRKIVFGVVMGGLTSVACSGCVWQYRRYKQSKERWDRISNQIKNFTPQKIEEIPWTLDTFEDYQYNLFSIEGSFIPEKSVLVTRTHDSRMGYLVIKPFQNDTKTITILINCGWIPKDYPEKNLKIGQKEKKIEIVGLLKKDENLEIKRTKKMYPRLEEFFNLIDNEQIGEALDIDFSGANGGFLEAIRGDDDEGEELYPVLPNKRNFSRPYLTPRKHAEYSTFWGLTAGIGLVSILKVLRM